jgi:hypothetical protein
MEADAILHNLHCALEPILLTERPESIDGRNESRNNILFKYNCPSVIDITLVATNSVISDEIVSTIGNAVIEPFK